MTDKDGNFTLAAHRDGHGAKFHNIDKVKKGDPIGLRDQGRLVRLQGLLDPPETSKFNVRSSSRSQAVRQNEARPLHHPDDLHTRLHLRVPVHRVGELERVEKVNSARTPRRPSWASQGYDEARLPWEGAGASSCAEVSVLRGGRVPVVPPKKLVPPLLPRCFPLWPWSSG